MTTQSWLDRIRTQCRYVAEQATYVTIVRENMPAVLDTMLAKPMQIPNIDPKSHYMGDEASTLAFFTTLAAINFGSGYFPQLRKREGCSGYTTIAIALTEQFQAHGPWSAQQLIALKREDCARLFHQDLSNPAIHELMGLFARALNDLGHDLIERYGGGIRAMLEAADRSSAKLVQVLSVQPFFHDVSLYNGTDVPFFKRAQLLASDLALALEGKGIGAFTDLHQLTIFADNLVPHVLRQLGLLDYAPQLREAIDSEELIPAGSPEEIEIRACTIHVVELLIEMAASRGVKWTARDIDQVLWHRGQDPAIKRAGKRHRTRTVFY